MKRAWVLISGIGLGAGLMYLLDPNRGRRRRALLRDKAVHLSRRSGRALAIVARHLRNRARGLVAKTRSRLASQAVSDEVLVERVRARIGHVISHPRAISVTASQGCVTLSGPIPAREAGPLLSAISSLPGVASVRDQLERRAEPAPLEAREPGTESDRGQSVSARETRPRGNKSAG